VIRLLIADDSPPAIRGIRSVLESVEDVRIVGEAKDLDEALRLIETLRPDVLLVDLNLRGSRASLFDLKNLATACACPVVAMSFASGSGLEKITTAIGAKRLLDKVTLYETLVPTLHEIVKSE
jgi:two-component system, NarL family, response regulator YdfI